MSKSFTVLIVETELNKFICWCWVWKLSSGIDPNDNDCWLCSPGAEAAEKNDETFSVEVLKGIRCLH